MNIKVFFFKFLIFLLFFGALSLFAQDQGKTYFDKNWNKTSTKSEVVYYRKWKKLGVEKYIINDYYLSGQLQMKALAKNSEDPVTKYGTVTRYYENGQIESVGKYEDDLSTGAWKYYYENGDIEKFGNYIEGDRNGKWVGFHKDSILEYEGTYLMGDQEEEWVWKYKNGQIAETVTYEEDKRITKRVGFYRTGKPRFFVGYNSKGEKHGDFWQKYQNGEFIKTGQYEEGKKTGTWSGYSESNQLLQEARFTKGKRDGVWTSYYETGKKESEVIYDNGIKKGPNFWCYKTGQMAFLESYKDGVLKKSKAFGPNGEKADAEKANVSPKVTSQNIADLLNKNLSQEIKDSEIEDIGVVFSIDAEDKFMNLDLILGKTDSSLVPKFEKQMGNLKWNSRIIMSEKYGSKEYYVLSKTIAGILVPTFDSYYSNFVKYKWFSDYCSTYSDEEDSDEADNDTTSVSDEIFTIVEDMPSFSGGESKLMSYLSHNTKYPTLAKNARIQGIVYVTFTVSQFGKVEDVRVLRGIGGGCDKEAARVVKGMPRWSPGFQRGLPVRVQYNIPIRFVLH